MIYLYFIWMIVSVYLLMSNGSSCRTEVCDLSKKDLAANIVLCLLCPFHMLWAIGYVFGNRNNAKNV